MLTVTSITLRIIQHMLNKVTMVSEKRVEILSFRDNKVFSHSPREDKFEEILLNGVPASKDIFAGNLIQFSLYTLY